MLKNYFDPTLTWQHQAEINDFLNQIPRYCVFSSYGQARSYRAANCFKNENGRYDFRIFLYDGFYYVASSTALSHLKWLIARLRQIESDDIHFKAFIDYTSDQLARDGVTIPKNLFDEVKK